MYMAHSSDDFRNEGTAVRLLVTLLPPQMIGPVSVWVAELRIFCSALPLVFACRVSG